jgi:CheY-like chemotaxis protein
MNGIIGMTGLLLDTPMSPEQRGYAEIVRTSGMALLDIINDILDFSKIESGKLTFERVAFPLRATVEDVLDLLAEQAQAKGLELVALFQPGLPESLLGDAGRLRQVLLNLVGNAVKFTESGEVVVEVRAEEGLAEGAMVRFEVRDTGVGIAADAQDRLFRPFSQADGSATRRYGGTGLGLAISRQLVELMGGEIGVRSSAGEGSTFWFTVPAGSAPPPSPATGGLHGARILCIVGHPIGRRAVREAVLALGADAHAVADRDAASGFIRAAAEAGRPYDALLLDDAAAVGVGETLPSVLVTSWRRRLETGASASVARPVRLETLRVALQRALGLVEAGDVAASEAIATPKAASALGRLRVLVVEDNKVNQQVASLLLGRLGHRVDLVANGLEAVEAVKRIPYDLVLMDCQMPELDGYEATRRIRSGDGAWRSVPIVAMTANAMRGDSEKCLAAGMDDYMSKPLSPELLAAKVAKWGAGREAEGPVDLQVIAVLRGIETDEEPRFFAELVDTFLTDLEERLQALSAAATAGDAERVRSVGHTLKGSAGNLGATRLSALAGQMEAAGRAGAMAEIASLLSQLESEARRVREFFLAERDRPG